MKGGRHPPGSVVASVRRDAAFRGDRRPGRGHLSLSRGGVRKTRPRPPTRAAAPEGLPRPGATRVVARGSGRSAKWPFPSRPGSAARSPILPRRPYEYPAVGSRRQANRWQPEAPRTSQSDACSASQVATVVSCGEGVCNSRTARRANRGRIAQPESPTAVVAALDSGSQGDHVAFRQQDAGAEVGFRPCGCRAATLPGRQSPRGTISVCLDAGYVVGFHVVRRKGPKAGRLADLAP